MKWLYTITIQFNASFNGSKTLAIYQESGCLKTFEVLKAHALAKLLKKLYRDPGTYGLVLVQVLGTGTIFQLNFFTFLHGQYNFFSYK